MLVLLILNDNKTIESIFEGYDEWLLIGNEPQRKDVDEYTERYDLAGNPTCLYCSSRLPEDHPLTVCDSCYPDEDQTIESDLEGYDEWLLIGNEP
ncbi:hypothetical protein [Lysinibacillus sphaericus]|uniref:hypothetical protein n=1 Tax=Lysinibacillus sphaericus TaxID=1421 RepID=UPI0009B88AF4|nr:hypothetical protein [Lysinibacillus sphaericus]QPA61311.1 hypothetical protein INQ55_23560 [Lysinibacillus sphaericus]